MQNKARPTPAGMNERRQIQVEGIVQGVGFRPFVYALATENGLGGFVLNNSNGVVIQVEGDCKALERFVKELREQAPRQTRIEKIACDMVPARGERSFTIAPSRQEEERRAFISPDRATCDQCLEELFDPANRRYHYPFINCTSCGPRFSIIRNLPYDREHTTMAAFTMCAECEREYHDSASRRFHAQANGCFACGPELRLLSADGSELKENDPISGAVRLLQSGAIIAVKGLGGYHLACNALDDRAVSALRRRKKRDAKPFALMAGDLKTIEQFCSVGEREKLLLRSDGRPIVLLQRREENRLAAGVAPAQKYFGWMLPYTPLHHLLLQQTKFALVMTSGNLSEEPIAYKDSDAVGRLRPLADYFLLNNREIHTRCDDSVVRNVAHRQITIRRSRGYAPTPLRLRQRFAQHTLGCGAHLKNTFCLVKDHHAFLSQHIGDLENYETLQSFNDAIEQLKSFFDVEPALIAHDLHPGFLSSQYAAGLNGAAKVAVQHHHAHIASCMAEHRLGGAVIGVAFDGLGYGDDGTLWGGEFLIADLAGYRRRAHLRYISLAGGESAIRQPWRSALSYMQDALETTLFALNLPGWQALNFKNVSLAEAMLERRVNTFRTSSCGRLFDAVASILGLCHESSFEAQAAMALEAAAARGVEDHYAFDIDSKEPLEIDMRPAIAALVREALAGNETARIAAKFHNTLVSVIVEICLRLRATEGLIRVCLSGGTFQNLYLLDRAIPELRRRGFEVFVNSRVPLNDGGISLGQAVIADAVMRRGAASCV